MEREKPTGKARLQVAWAELLRWLTPGLGVKRWLFLLLAGITFIAVGLAIAVLDVYRTAPETWWLPVLSYLSLRFLPRLVRAIIFGGIGVGIIGLGIWGLNRSILAPFLRPGLPVVDTIARYRKRERGSRIVVIGGGHGLSTLLRGLKRLTSNLTAIVTVADDGGSSGRLRNALGVLPPGDIRNCLAALSDDEDLITQLFQYRFGSQGGELEGHSFGNLFISALSELTGSFEEAVAESGRVMGVSGQVLPSTLHDVQLIADKTLPMVAGEVRVHGESRIPQMGGKVRRVWLEPNNPPAFPKAVRALLQADMVVIGPGSLYTSILPNLLVPEIASALRASPAFKVFVCNVATQPGETDGYTCADHVRALEAHAGTDLFDLVVVNRCMDGELLPGYAWVQGGEDLESLSPVYESDVANAALPGTHDAARLSQTLMDLLQARTGPLVE
ncbi:MAG: YvcK family protein [Anaerolineae bacterium]|nr:MAG: YvcK family protein [Anaerolineae bacterium]